MCSSVLLPWHKGHNGVSALPQQKRLAGLGRTSYTDWTWNLRRDCSAFQSSVHVISTIWWLLIYLDKIPCWQIPGFELARESWFIHFHQPSVQLLDGGFDWGRVFQTAIKCFPKTLHWLFCDGWNTAIPKREMEPVHHLTSLEYQRPGFCWLKTGPM